MLAVLLPTDAERFSVENENAAWRVRIYKDGTSEITMQVLQDGNVAPCARRPHPAIGAAIKHVAIMEHRSRFPASAVDSERVLASVTFPSATAEPDSFSGAAKCALFFMDELREG